MEFELTDQPKNGVVRLSTRQADKDDIATYQEELLGYYAIMREFDAMEPDHVFGALSAMSARMSEIRTLLVRRESRRASHFRTQEVDKFLEECDRQFKYHSRIQATRDFDLRMTGGIT